MTRSHVTSSAVLTLLVPAALAAQNTARPPGPPRGPINVALASEGAEVVAGSEGPDEGADRLIDGRRLGPNAAVNLNRWHSAPKAAPPHWIWIGFRRPALISRAVIHRAALAHHPVDFALEYSPDGVSYRTLFAVTGHRMDAETYAVERSFDPVVTDHVLLVIARSAHPQMPQVAQLSEIEVFGSFVDDAGASPPPAPSGALPEDDLPPTPQPALQMTERDEEIEFRSPWLRVALARSAPQISALCWDSLGEGKVDENLLKPGPSGGARPGMGASRTLPAGGLEVSRQGNVIRYAWALPDGGRARWAIRVSERAIDMAIAWDARRTALLPHPPGVQFAFAVDKTPVAPFADPRPGVTAPLPCLLHASDYGSLLVRAPSEGRAVLTGQPIRAAAQWNAFVGVPVDAPPDRPRLLPRGAGSLRLALTVERAPVPGVAAEDPRLRALPRHWLNTFQYRPDLGILSNNVVSDNAVFCLFTFTDPAVFTPPLPGGVEAIHVARESLDRYLSGAPGYGPADITLDTNPALLITAWTVARVTGDLELLRRWLPRLERLASQTEQQDRDGNGLPESTRPGLPGQHVCPGSNWWDQINFGHEDAYVCALTYRAFRCLADLERLAERPDEAKRFDRVADRIAAAYVPTFYNPQTGLLAGWKDRNGALHDYAFVFVNGIAIDYGLVPDDLARKIVDRMEAKLRDVRYTRFDLGLPGNLVPVPKFDYGRNTLGSPQRDDGSDSFGIFENGGTTACYAYFYIQALYRTGRREEAERILWPMMKAYADGGFQNGVRGQFLQGGEWRRWDGRPSGYEGFLADAYYTQMAVFTGHYGIAFGPDGFRLEPWSPLKGKRVPLGLKYMGRVVETLE